MQSVKKELLSKLYSMYQKEIYLYLYSLCKNTALAEDLMQETFLKALLSLDDHHTNMRAWLYMVARNLYYNYWKREKSRIPLDEAVNLDDGRAQAMLERMIADERRRFLFQALGRLERKKREILQMQYFSRLSQKEIAGILQMTPENVRVLSYRARQELKSYMEVQGYDVS